MSATNIFSTLRVVFSALTLSVSLLACAQTPQNPMPAAKPAAAATTTATKPATSATTSPASDAPISAQAPQTPKANAATSPANLIACPTQRAEMCASIYKPVCASRDTGVRCVRAPCPSEAPATFSNACSACRDPKVYGYTEGACGKALPSM